MSRGLIISAPASGSGKTFITLALLAALRKQGVAVASAKIGPDYIDPAFHAKASAKPCFNLDGWAMRAPTLASLHETLTQQADLILCEGVMGLFDGASTQHIERDDGSPADIARRTGWPVVLVVDVSAQATSAAALVKGFVDFDPEVHIRGVIFNKVGGEGHQRLLEAAFKHYLPEVAILGYIPRQNHLALPERHLGLVQASEHPDLDRFFDDAADFITRHIDVRALQDLAGASTLAAQAKSAQPTLPVMGQHIAIAHDVAFAFVYPHLLSQWRAQGVELSFFSPLADQAPDETCDAIYLPGGYPELYGGILATAETFRAALQTAARAGKTVFGECGGYMTLGQGLIDKDGTRHQMLGLLELETSFEKRKLHLGYRQARFLNKPHWATNAPGFRGHEFHYSRIIKENGAPLFQGQNAAGVDLGPMGLINGSVSGSFLHLIDVVQD